MNTIVFDYKNNDYIVNGKTLLSHLEKHEHIEPERYVPSIYSQEHVCERLLGEAAPDLSGGHVSIYLCSHCGGYDGNPIGVKVIFEDDKVYWKEIGYYHDHCESNPFAKVRELSFPLNEYIEFIKDLKIYSPKNV